jgi:hypothetical protein
MTAAPAIIRAWDVSPLVQRPLLDGSRNQGAHAPRSGIVAILLFGIAAPLAAAEPAYRIERITGDPLTAEEFRVENSAVILREAPEPISLHDIISVIRTEPAIEGAEAPASLVWLANGDWLAATPVEIDEETLTARWNSFPERKPLKISLEFVTALAPQLPAAPRRRLSLLRALAVDPQTDDLAWLANGDRLAGTLTGFSAGEYQWKTEAGPLPILQQNLRALRFSPDLVADVEPAETRSLLTLADGSRVTATKFTRSAGELRFTSPWADDVVLPASALAELHVASPRIELLSERKPERFEHTPYVGGAWPLLVDRNAAYGPLCLRGRTCAFGLGVHSRSEIVFQLEPNDREFRAEVGIDDLAEGEGSAVFVVLVDDREVWSSGELTGQQPLMTVPPISLQGAKRLTLRVDFGQFGDVQDYADWCCPVVIRK